MYDVSFYLKVCTYKKQTLFTQEKAEILIPDSNIDNVDKRGTY